MNEQYHASDNPEQHKPGASEAQVNRFGQRIDPEDPLHLQEAWTDEQAEYMRALAREKGLPETVTWVEINAYDLSIAITERGLPMDSTWNDIEDFDMI